MNLIFTDLFIANATAVSLAGQLCDMFIYIITSLKLGIWNQQLILIEVIK